MTMQQQPSRWLWLTPLSVSVLAGWLMLNGIAAELPLPAAQPASGDSAYPAPDVDAAQPPEPATSTF